MTQPQPWRGTVRDGESPPACRPSRHTVWRGRRSGAGCSSGGTEPPAAASPPWRRRPLARAAPQRPPWRRVCTQSSRPSARDARAPGLELLPVRHEQLLRPHEVELQMVRHLQGRSQKLQHLLHVQVRQGGADDLDWEEEAKPAGTCWGPAPPPPPPRARGSPSSQGTDSRASCSSFLSLSRKAIRIARVKSRWRSAARTRAGVTLVSSSNGSKSIRASRE